MIVIKEGQKSLLTIHPDLQELYDAMNDGLEIEYVLCSRGKNATEEIRIENFIAEVFIDNITSNVDASDEHQWVGVIEKRQHGQFYMEWVKEYKVEGQDRKLVNNF